MVILVTAILAVVVGRFVAQPVEGYLDADRRARLLDLADTALERMTREIRLALPNSVRVSGTGRDVEFLRVLTGARYRRAPPGDPLDFTVNSDSFDVLGTLLDAGRIAVAGGATQAGCVADAVDCLVIYNTGQPGADAYNQDNIAAIRAASATSVTFARTSPFPLTSAQQRFYVVDTPVSFLCDDGAAQNIRRYSNYAITANHASVDEAAELLGAGAAETLLVEQVSACSFSYQPGTATRGGLVTLALTVEEAGEQVSVLQQVHVSNLP
ncbi:MAG: pilus assembly protein MshO [Gammaproteobacteria bacterium]|nr:pilus assembly protein MshO [Gammaproteobacteria bacterium]